MAATCGTAWKRTTASSASGLTTTPDVIDRTISRCSKNGARMVQLTAKTAVPELAQVAWRTVGSIVERVVEKFKLRRGLDNLVLISVDETAYKRGHR